MAELTQVLGAILRDVAQSRVLSDTFSRDISIDYANDPILVNFPVPRVEIKQASIQLNFAVNSVEHKPVDTDSLVRVAVSRLAGQLGEQVFARVVLENPKRDQLEAILKERGLDLPAKLADAAQSAILGDSSALAATLQGNPDALLKKLQADLLAALAADEAFYATLRKVSLVRDLREIVTSTTTPAVAGFVQELKQAVSNAGTGTFSVDVAVTRGDLADVPETILSHVSIVTEIRNYAWTEVGEVDGQPVRRLQPE